MKRLEQLQTSYLIVFLVGMFLTSCSDKLPPMTPEVKPDYRVDQIIGEWVSIYSSKVSQAEWAQADFRYTFYRSGDFKKELKVGKDGYSCLGRYAWDGEGYIHVKSNACSIIEAERKIYEVSRWAVYIFEFEIGPDLLVLRSDDGYEIGFERVRGESELPFAP